MAPGVKPGILRQSCGKAPIAPFLLRRPCGSLATTLRRERAILRLSWGSPLRPPHGEERVFARLEP